MAASPPCSGVTTDLLNLHKECLVRFDTVTLVQKRVDEKKVLFLTVDIASGDSSVSEKKTIKELTQVLNFFAYFMILTI